MAKFEQVELTPAQEILWEQTRAKLLWQAPAFTFIFYEMLNNADSKHIAMFTKEVPIAATDGSNMILNPDTFFKYDLDERIFANAHEILHCVLNHCVQGFKFAKSGKIIYPDGSTLPYDPEVANISMDLVINDMLIEAKVGKFNKDWLHDKSFGVHTDSWIDVYKKVFKAKQGGGKGPNGHSFDQHLAPGTSQGNDPTSAAGQRNDAQWGQVMAGAAAIEAATRKQGQGPGALERFFGAQLDPVVDWKERIRALFSRKVGSGSYDWRRADRRLISRFKDPIYAPARSGFGCGVVVVAADTSGSIGPKEIDMFFAEMHGIMDDCTPRELVIMWCDAHVHDVDHADEISDLNTIRRKPVKGGGGTDFRPVFDKIGEMGLEPDALVYLTDGQGSFPDKAPAYPVIWGNIYPASKYPFGDVVEVPKQV
jgi:predicted metal-dependent peptidase